jgi:hypothetical protein
MLPLARFWHRADVTAADGSLTRAPFGRVQIAPGSCERKGAEGAQVEKLFLFSVEGSKKTQLIFGGSASGALIVWDYP